MTNNRDSTLGKSNRQKLILYGIGIVCNRIMHNWQKLNPGLIDSILCFADSRAETWGRVFYGKPVIAPNEICRWDYEKIIITSEKYADEIYQMLVKQFDIEAHRILSYPHGEPEEPVFVPNYKLYMDDSARIKEYCTYDYFLDKAADSSMISNGYILPFRFTEPNRYQGGVHNEAGAFVAGHVRETIRRSFNFDDLSAYLALPEAEYVEEVVVYGGILFSHFGHMVTESLTRLWWHLDNPNSGYRFAFLRENTAPVIWDFLSMLGITEDKLLLIDRPMQFKAIIIPEQATVLRHGGYREQAMRVYDAIRNQVKPAGYDKIYLTRTKLSEKLQMINESYFEDHFRSQGYVVIAPEQLTVKEQVAIMAGARHVACISGTLSHNILFCQDGVELTILCRSDEPIPPQYWINQARKANCTMIDVSMSFLMNRHSAPSYLLFPTIHWRRYLKDEGIAKEPSEQNLISDFAPKIVEYIIQWSRRWLEENRNRMIWVDMLSLNLMLSDMIVKLCEETQGGGSNAIMKHRLYLQMGVDFWNTDAVISRIPLSESDSMDS